MAISSDSLFTSYSCDNVVPKIRVRRRPKLLPPSNKLFTRARINLNNVWPHLESRQSDPLQSSNRFNVNQQTRGNKNVSSNNSGNLNVNNHTSGSPGFVHNPQLDANQNESMYNDYLRSQNLLDQINFYTSKSIGLDLNVNNSLRTLLQSKNKNVETADDLVLGCEVPMASLSLNIDGINENERHANVPNILLSIKPEDFNYDSDESHNGADDSGIIL